MRPANRYNPRVFTGIIRSLGVVTALRTARAGGRIEVRARLRARPGDSVAVNGVCLTVTSARRGRLVFDLMKETLDRTALGALRPGDRANLEPSLRAGDPMGGHLVMGHVDGVGTILRRERVGDGAVLRIGVERGIARMLAPKGCVAVDGVSLTVTAVDRVAFEVGLIPFTLRRTTLGSRGRGDRVNIEVDILARYLAAGIGLRPSDRITKELLRRAGFLGPGR